MEEAPRCRCCRHAEWVRGNVVMVPGADGPLRGITRCPHGPACPTCANCGYVAPTGGGIDGRLARAPGTSRIRTQVSRPLEGTLAS